MTSQDWSSYLDPTLLALGSSSGSDLSLSLSLSNSNTNAQPQAQAPSPTPSLASSASGSVGGLGVGDADDFSPLSPLLNLFKLQSTFPFPCDQDVQLAPVPTISPVDAPMLQYTTNSILVGSPSARSTTSSSNATATTTNSQHQNQQAEALSLASWVIEEHGRSFSGGKSSSRQRSASTSTAGTGMRTKRGASAEGGVGSSSSADKVQSKVGWLQKLREAEKAAERRGEASPRVRW